MKNNWTTVIDLDEIYSFRINLIHLSSYKKLRFFKDGLVPITVRNGGRGLLQHLRRVAVSYHHLKQQYPPNRHFKWRHRYQGRMRITEEGLSFPCPSILSFSPPASFSFFSSSMTENYWGGSNGVCRGRGLQPPWWIPPGTVISNDSILV
jgi:hypothetical protein